MANINAVVNEQIRRLARREINTGTRVVKRATAHFRRDIAPQIYLDFSTTRNKLNRKCGDSIAVCLIAVCLDE